MKVSKEKLCKKFVSDPGDDIFHIVETLVDLRTQSCPCVYPSTKPCKFTAESPNQFGFCKAHLKTKKGFEFAQLWNTTLEELDIQESEDVEDESVDEDATDDEATDEPVDEEEDEEEEVEEEKPKEIVIASKKPKSVLKKVPEVPQPPKKTKVPKAPARKPKKMTDGSEESSAAEGSAKAHYVAPPSEDDEVNDAAEEEEEEKPTMKFSESKFGNYVNDKYGFVLRPRDNVVLGTESKKGGIVKLTADQIEICKKVGLAFLSE